MDIQGHVREILGALTLQVAQLRAQNDALVDQVRQFMEAAPKVEPPQQGSEE